MYFNECLLTLDVCYFLYDSGLRMRTHSKNLLLSK